uniref:SPK domain-containing protein n=1 Tax=Caenorhabditis tropicalis TaxID=1561998 RepID=A0A1I7SZA1_9PELO
MPISYELSPFFSDHRKLLDFLIKEVDKKPRILFNLYQISRDFKSKTKSSGNIECLRNRIQQFRFRLQELRGMDKETRVKISFAISAPIDFCSLNELKEDAEVILDSTNRIIKYKKMDGSLELSGTHNSASPVWNENHQKMIDFLIEKSKNQYISISDETFIREFQKLTRTSENWQNLEFRYNCIKNRILELKEIERLEKIQMIFVSRARVSAAFLEEIREGAFVEVYDHNRIKTYISNDGRVQLGGNQSSKHEKSIVFGSEMTDIIEFMIEKCEKTNVPLSVFKLCKEYIEHSGSTKSLRYWQIKTFNFQKMIHKQRNLDMESKVKLMFGMGSRVKNDFLNVLRKKAVVEVDEQGRIKRFQTKNLHLQMKENFDSEERIDEGSERKAEEFVKVISDDAGFRRENEYFEADYEIEEQPIFEMKPSWTDKVTVDSKPEKRMFRSISVAAGGKSEVKTETPVQDFQPPVHDIMLSRSSHKSLLSSLHTVMISLEIPISQRMEERFRRTLGKLSGFEKIESLSDKVTFSELQCSINSCLLILAKCSPPPPEEPSISLRDFTLLFRNTLISLKLPFLSGFENTLKTMFGMFSNHDKRVSTDKIESALGTIIGIIAP